MSNHVDEINFNSTAKGYTLRAIEQLLSHEEYEDLDHDKLIRHLIGCMDFAFDMMSMSEARKKYDKYCKE